MREMAAAMAAGGSGALDPAEAAAVAATPVDSGEFCSFIYCCEDIVFRLSWSALWDGKVLSVTVFGLLA
jgi:hypothetical protein